MRAQLRVHERVLDLYLWGALQLVTNMSEEMFREMLAGNQMATDKLAEGVTKFAADQDKCEARIAERAAEWGLTLK